MPWYDVGLRFSCTRCGRCCTGAPGHTWISETEIAALAARLGQDREGFLRLYTRQVWRGGIELISLTERPNHDCVFWLVGKGCSVYEDRPRQCRTWPFWRVNLDTPEDWAQAARGCPGMDHGERHPAEKIAAIAADDGLPG